MGKRNYCFIGRSLDIETLINQLEITEINQEIIKRRVVRVVSSRQKYVHFLFIAKTLINIFMFLCILIVMVASAVQVYRVDIIRLTTPISEQIIMWIQLISVVLFMIIERIKTATNLSQVYAIREYALNQIIDDIWNFITLTGPIYQRLSSHNLAVGILVDRIQQMNHKNLSDLMGKYNLPSVQNTEISLQRVVSI